MVYKRTFIPSQPVHPGNTLGDLLDSHWMSQKELSLRIGITEKHISNITRGNVSVTPNMALKLEKVFGVSSDFWNNLEISYQQDLSRLEEEKQLQNEISLVDDFTCYSELCKLWFVQKTRNKMEKLKNLLIHFGVTSLLSLPQLQDNLYRKSDKYRTNKESLVSWLRCGEIKAKDIQVEDYSKRKLDKVIEELKLMTREKQPDLDKIQSLLGDCGIIFTFVPSFKGVPVNGVSKKLNNKPFIQVGDRNKRLDTFWFSLFHEISHIILHLSKKDDLFLNFEDKEDKIEEEANVLGSDLLVWNKEFNSFVSLWKFSHHSINSFSKKVGVWSCIVRWRLAFIEKITYWELNKFWNKFEIKG